MSKHAQSVPFLNLISLDKLILAPAFFTWVYILNVTLNTPLFYLCKLQKQFSLINIVLSGVV